MERVKNWYKHKLVQPWKRLTAMEKVFCLVVGVLGGMFPVPGVTTFVGLVISKLLALSAPQIAVSSAVNLVLAPVQLMAIPFLAQFAAVFTGADASTFTATFLAGAAADGMGVLLSSAGSMLLHAICLWAVVSGAVLGVMYTFLLNPKAGKRELPA